MKFTKKTKSAIFQECRKRIGGFGMWWEVQLRIAFTDDSYYTNRLRKGDDDSDLYDFIASADFLDYDFEMIKGMTLLDVPVHDSEQLLENLLILINDKGEIIRSFDTFEACHDPYRAELRKYEEAIK